MAHPGTLPVPNKDAIKKVSTVGLAIGANIADFTEFDRKNYFYPDIPKGYQLSQYKYPIVSGGEINGVQITRVHLEEDTAKSSHENGITLVDYNRAGVPLMELVTEPVIHSAEQAGAFARELQRILRYVGASEANMEMGQMRVEANISVSKDPNQFGTKCEVKNLNSFASVEAAINFEVARHIELIESGGTVIQETRGWDENKQETFSQRKKENAHDYRYFPDPDLPKFYLKEVFDLDELKASLPKLPKQLRKEWKIKEDLKEVLLNEVVLARFFIMATEGKNETFQNLVANYLTVDVLGILKRRNLSVTKENLPDLCAFQDIITMIIDRELSSEGAKTALLYITPTENDVNIRKYVKEKGLIQKNDPEALKVIVQEVLAESPTQVADYKAGKEAMFMYFVGQCMKKSKGSGNPGLFQEILKEELK